MNCSSGASLTCGWRIVISPMIPRISLPCYDSAMGNLLVLSQSSACHYTKRSSTPSRVVKLSVQKSWSGRVGFDPPSSWSRTSLDQAKYVELTAFSCAFPRLIWATWATKYRCPICRPFAVHHVVGSQVAASQTALMAEGTEGMLEPLLGTVVRAFRLTTEPCNDVTQSFDRISTHQTCSRGASGKCWMPWISLNSRSLLVAKLISTPA